MPFRVITGSPTDPDVNAKSVKSFSEELAGDFAPGRCDDKKVTRRKFEGEETVAFELDRKYIYIRGESFRSVYFRAIESYARWVTNALLIRSMRRRRP